MPAIGNMTGIKKSRAVAITILLNNLARRLLGMPHCLFIPDLIARRSMPSNKEAIANSNQLADIKTRINSITTHCKSGSDHKENSGSGLKSSLLFFCSIDFCLGNQLADSTDSQAKLGCHRSHAQTAFDVGAAQGFFAAVAAHQPRCSHRRSPRDVT